MSKKKQRSDLREGTLHFLNTYCVLNHRLSTALYRYYLLESLQWPLDGGIFYPILQKRKLRLPDVEHFLKSHSESVKELGDASPDL